MPLIAVKNLEKTYYNESIATPVLNGVSFSIQAGEFVAIMGPSGSGKSTLLHILGFLDRHTAGEYRFDGKTVDDYSKDALAHLRNKKIGFIFQMFNLLRRASVYDNVQLPLLYADSNAHATHERVLTAIEAVGLSHRKDHEPSQLSGGEQQRVAIARALVNDPQVLFADEPTGNLDSKSGKAIMEILERLYADKKHTIILITHDMYVAKHAERIIRLHDGNIASDERTSKYP